MEHSLYRAIVCKQGSPANYRGEYLFNTDKTLNNLLYSFIQLTLNLQSYILFVVVISCPFGAQKDQKARHTEKSSQVPFARAA